MLVVEARDSGLLLLFEDMAVLDRERLFNGTICVCDCGPSMLLLVSVAL